MIKETNNRLETDFSSPSLDGGRGEVAPFRMIAKTFQGLEDVLAEELINLGANDIEIGRRMVSFRGDLRMLYKANLCCHTALRILKPIHTFRASDTDELYKAVKKVAWERFMNVDQTFAIDSVVFSDEFKHTKFVAYRVKDAIADYFQEKQGKRPSVRINKPDIEINIHIAQSQCTLSLDSSGESLHRRGYRLDQTEAPLNEVLAAGMILKSGWRGETDFVDPMCGSGTLLVEAALIARNIAPGIYRSGFAFEKWADFDQELFDELYNDESAEREFTHTIYGSDIMPKAIEIAERNIKRAGMAKHIKLRVLPFQQYQNGELPGSTLITNPPYGERISSKDLLGLYEMIGERLKHGFMGCTAWILSYRKECFDSIGLKPTEKIELMNGSLECEFRKYDIFDGKYKEFRQTDTLKPERRDRPAPSRGKSERRYRTN